MSVVTAVAVTTATDGGHTPSPYHGARPVATDRAENGG